VDCCLRIYADWQRSAPARCLPRRRDKPRAKGVGRGARRAALLCGRRGEARTYRYKYLGQSWLVAVHGPVIGPLFEFVIQKVRAAPATPVCRIATRTRQAKTRTEWRRRRGPHISPGRHTDNSAGAVDLGDDADWLRGARLPRILAERAVSLSAAQNLTASAGRFRRSPWPPDDEADVPMLHRPRCHHSAAAERRRRGVSGAAWLASSS